VAMTETALGELLAISVPRLSAVRQPGCC
jgi:hypothetical protein